MALNEEERAIMVQREFEKALTFYEQALLIRDQHKVGTHKGAVLMFGMHYVKTGLFSTDEARFYSQLQTLREKADYNCIWEATERDVLPMMPLAQAFLDKIKQRLEPYI